MPVEYALLHDQPVPLESCPKCGAAPFVPFLRGTVQSGWRRLLKRPYCCLICAKCKCIVGYEEPEREDET